MLNLRKDVLENSSQLIHSPNDVYCWLMIENCWWSPILPLSFLFCNLHRLCNLKTEKGLAKFNTNYIKLKNTVFSYFNESKTLKLYPRVLREFNELSHDLEQYIFESRWFGRGTIDRYKLHKNKSLLIFSPDIPIASSIVPNIH